MKYEKATKKKVQQRLPFFFDTKKTLFVCAIVNLVCLRAFLNISQVLKKKIESSKSVLSGLLEKNRFFLGNT